MLFVLGGRISRTFHNVKPVLILPLLLLILALVGEAAELYYWAEDESGPTQGQWTKYSCEQATSGSPMREGGMCAYFEVPPVTTCTFKVFIRAGTRSHVQVLCTLSLHF